MLAIILHYYFYFLLLDLPPARSRKELTRLPGVRYIFIPYADHI